ncbi:hypothetical protein TeGR_g221 [Tetraparma gracilis]|uniref:Glycoside hydrolase family 5 domain-containing protein n=1 Tax=Tetraparma gracilis TaxID=2962635 RepID=A0ABQ6M8M3_9STRA|nr:hypothetical protein TeGR_g221 [Tetraparma gracilis]
MFSFHQFDRVAEMDDTPQGVVMPPLLPDGFGSFWYSEGDLVNQLVDKYGEDFAVDVIEAHRSSYISDSDLDAMRAAGITSVRMPVGWWAFIPESLEDEAKVISDPAHPDRKFVTITQAFLKDQIERFESHGLDVLLDIHAFPGGSANGSYNGVYPNEPKFFSSPDLMTQGMDIIDSLADFFLSFDDATRNGIIGVTLMNEPAHLLDGDSADTMQVWLKAAIGAWRDKVVTAVATPPKMYVNLIETAISPADMITFMHSAFSDEELDTWAVLDVHHYFAWDSGHSGCDENSGNTCGYNCSTSATSEGLDEIKEIVTDGCATSHEFWISEGTVPMISCSEYSLATFENSNVACRGDTVLSAMFNAQKQSFEDQGLEAAWFWTWKMPYGGSHEYAWSLKHYLGLGH